MPKETRIQTCISYELEKRISETAKKQGLTKNEFVRFALANAIENQERGTRVEKCK